MSTTTTTDPAPVENEPPGSERVAGRTGERPGAPAAPPPPETRQPSPGPAPVGIVGGPVPVGWREGTLTRATELETLCNCALLTTDPDVRAITQASVGAHLTAAREAAKAVKLEPRRWRPFRNASLLERAMSNLDAAEAELLNVAPPAYVLGQMASFLAKVQCHLVRGDPRRQELERIARAVGVLDPGPSDPATFYGDAETRKREAIVATERGRIVTAMRAAASASLREQVRVRSFRNVIVVTTVVMTLLAVVIAALGWLNPTAIPLCFAPEEAGQIHVVCPTAQSAPLPATGAAAGGQAGVSPSGSAAEDVDDAVATTATPIDLLIVELVGLTAAAVAAAGAIRSIRGSSERHSLPVALAVLKLPTGAITAFLGLLLMRGQFVPGLSALDTSAQIVAWALIFGYAQQVFTRLVDRQGDAVLDGVRGANRPVPSPSPP
jgi:hypothetical protein